MMQQGRKAEKVREFVERDPDDQDHAHKKQRRAEPHEALK